MDLMTADRGSATVSVLVGTGARGFAQARKQFAFGTKAIATADINDDGLDDALVLNGNPSHEGVQAVHLLLGTAE